MQNSISFKKFKHDNDAFQLIKSGSSLLLNYYSGSIYPITLLNFSSSGIMFGTASYALTASYAMNGGGSSIPPFPFSGSAVITGSLSQGFNNIASGSVSHAEGDSTISIGYASHTEGVNTTSIGSYSHAEGSSTIAIGNFSHSEGDNTTAIGDWSHAEGTSTTSKGESSHAEGQSTIASGYASHAEGYITTAIGDYSHAEGQSTIASGFASHAEGDNTLAIGDWSHAEGTSTTAVGEGSHAEGESTTSIGTASHTEGSYTTAVGNSSHAEGWTTTAVGQASHAEGFYTIAKGDFQHVQGTYNISSSNPGAFILGNGVSNASRSNLIYASGSNVQITGSLNVSGSIAFNGDITGSNALFTGTITAQKLIVQTISSSVVYSSGSTKFGNDITNTHQFTGSVLVTGSITSNNGLILTDGTYGSKTWMSSYIYTIEKNGGNGPTTYQFKYNDGTSALYLNNTSLQSDTSYNVLASSRDLTSPNNGAFAFQSLGSTTKYPALSASYSDNNTSGINIMYKSSGVDYNGLSLTSAGNVGIGTSSPSSKLHISGAIGTGLRVDGISSTGLTVQAGGLAGGSGTVELFAGNNNNSYLRLASEYIREGGNGGLGINVIREDIVSKFQIKGSGATSATTALLVQNSNLSSSLTVLDNGYVGINTGSAQYILDIQGVTSPVTANVVRLKTANNSVYPAFMVGDDSEKRMVVGANGSGGNAYFTGTGGRANLAYAAYFGSAAGYATQIGTYSGVNMTLLDNGNVGIGTSNPSQLLHVSGNALINGSIYFGDGSHYLTTDNSTYAMLSSNRPLQLATSGTPVLTVFTSKNVGIGYITDNGYKLDVSGSGRFTNGLTNTGSLAQSGSSTFNGGTYLFKAASTGDGGIQFDNSINGYTSINWTSNAVGFGLMSGGGILANVNGGYGMSITAVNKTNPITNISPGAVLNVRGSGSSAGSTALLVQNNNASASLSVLDNGYVGIGTATPSASLQVGASTGTIQIGANTNANITATSTGGLTLNANIGTGNPLSINNQYQFYYQQLQGNGSAYFTGWLGAGSATRAGLSTLSVYAAVTATSGSGLVSIGNGPWDNTTTGFFTGSSSGTMLAINASASYSGNILDFQTTGSSKLVLTSAGNVGIGTSTPAYTLDVNGNIHLGIDNSLYLVNTRFVTNNGSIYMGDINNQNTPFYLVPQGGSSNGSLRVGGGQTILIKGSGATNATTALLVQNNNASASLTVNDAGELTSNVRGNSGIKLYSSGEAYYRQYNTGDTISPFTIYTNGGAYGSQYAQIGLNDSVDSSNQGAAMYLDTRAGIPPIRFVVKPAGTTSMTSSMVITTAGNVGIGTATPSYLLDVSGSARFTNGINVTGSLAFTGDITGSNALFTGTITAQKLIVQQVTSSIIYSSGSNIFGSQLTDVQSFTGSLRVTGSGDHWVMGGNVGIGIATPSVKLHVIGTIHAQTSLSLGGNADSISPSSNSGFLDFNSAQSIKINPGSAFSTIFSSTGNVGIGTASPVARLHVVSGSSTAWIGTGGYNTGTGTQHHQFISTDNSAVGTMIVSQRNTSATGTTLYVQNLGTGHGIYSTSAKTYFSGSVGIGIDTPTKMLDLRGDMYIASGGGQTLTITTNNNTPSMTFTGYAVDSGFINIVNNNIPYYTLGIGGYTQGINYTGTLNASTPGNGMNFISVYPTYNTSGTYVATVRGFYYSPTLTSTTGLTNIAIETTSGTVIFNGGKVGIGTSTPSASLHVAGTTLLSSSFNTAISGSTLKVQGSGSTQPIFTVVGSQGELFSITDSLSGSLFSVNDISGLPILEVFSDNTILTGDYQAPALNTTKKITSTTAGINVIYSFPTSSYDGAFMDYTVRSGSNARAGNFAAIWSGSSVNYMDNSTTDFGSTLGMTLSGSISGSNMVIFASGSTAGWTFKGIIKSI